MHTAARALSLSDKNYNFRAIIIYHPHIMAVQVYKHMISAGPGDERGFHEDISVIM